MRLFIAVPVGDAVRDGAAAVLADLRASRADYKWVEPRHLHLTLAFLGELDAARLPGLGGAIEAAAADRKPFPVVFGQLGAFDSFARPKVLWLGVSEGAARLKELEAALRAGLAERGFMVEEREFTPHLTLGRMRSMRNLANLRARLGHWSDPSRLGRLRAVVDRLLLIESRLSDKGPEYTVLQEARLRE